jgi:hypothetical protein
MEDNEIQQINERKLKEKGAKVVEQQKAQYNPEQINEKQGKRNQQNVSDEKKG